MTYEEYEKTIKSYASDPAAAVDKAIDLINSIKADLDEKESFRAAIEAKDLEIAELKRQNVEALMRIGSDETKKEEEKTNEEELNEEYENIFKEVE